LQHDASRREGELALFAGGGCRGTRAPGEIGERIFWSYEAVTGAASSAFDEDLEEERELRQRERGCGEAFERNPVGEPRAEARSRAEVIAHDPSSSTSAIARAALRDGRRSP
jgi:hypothetical protein